jgi:hypothetical protein
MESARAPQTIQLTPRPILLQARMRDQTAAEGPEETRDLAVLLERRDPKGAETPGSRTEDAGSAFTLNVYPETLP